MSTQNRENDKLRARKIASSAIGVIRQNYRLFSLIIIGLSVLSAIVIWIESHIKDSIAWDTLSDIDPGNVFLLITVILEITFLRMALVKITWNTLHHRPIPTLKEMYSERRNWVLNFPMVRVLLMSLSYTIIAIVPLVALSWIFELSNAEPLARFIPTILVIILIVFLCAKLYLIIPISILERNKIDVDFRLSIVMTRGHIWGILRVFMFSFLLVVIVFISLVAAIMLWFEATMDLDNFPTITQRIIFQIHLEEVKSYLRTFASPIIGAMFAVWDGVLNTVCYKVIREIRNNRGDASVVADACSSGRA